MLEVRLSCQSNIPPVFQVESPLTDSPKTRFSPGSITTGAAGLVVMALRKLIPNVFATLVLVS